MRTLINLSIAAILMDGCAMVNVVPSIPQQLANVVSITPQEGEYCSGWVLKGSHTVVTAAHCSPDDMTSVINVDFGDGVNHPFHIQYLGKDTEGGAHLPDLMTLTTNDDSIKWPVGFEVCKFEPYYGEALQLMGGPLGRSKTVSWGHVSNPNRDVSSEDPDYGSYIQYDGAMFPGNSGGPAIDMEHGCVMGSSDFMQPMHVGSVPIPVGLNFLTPMSQLKEILK